MDSNYNEWYWDHNQYYRPDWGEKKISCPPLINTSLGELSRLKWNLTAEARYIPKHDASKVKFNFHAPMGQIGYPFLIYKGWIRGKRIRTASLMLDVLYEQDLTPNFNKPPSFSLIPKKEDDDKFIERVIKEENEAFALKTENIERLKRTSLASICAYRDQISSSKE